MTRIEWAIFIRYIGIPVFTAVLLVLAAYLTERKNLPDKKGWRPLVVVYVASVLLYTVPLWRDDVYSLNDNLFMRAFTVWDNIFFGSLGALAQQSFMGFALAVMVKFQYFIKTRPVKKDYGEYSTLSKTLFMLSHLFGSYYMQGVLCLLKNDFDIYPLYRKLHDGSGLAFLSCFILYVLVTDPPRRKK